MRTIHPICEIDDKEIWVIDPGKQKSIVGNRAYTASRKPDMLVICLTDHRFYKTVVCAEGPALVEVSDLFNKDMSIPHMMEQSKKLADIHSPYIWA